jgi:hypothetical protein
MEWQQEQKACSKVINVIKWNYQVDKSEREFNTLEIIGTVEGSDTNQFPHSNPIEWWNLAIMRE